MYLKDNNSSQARKEWFLISIESMNKRDYPEETPGLSHWYLVWKFTIPPTRFFPLLCHQGQCSCAVCVGNLESEKAINFLGVNAHTSLKVGRLRECAAGSGHCHDDVNRASLPARVLYVIVEMLLAGGDHIPRILPQGGAQLAQGWGSLGRRQEASDVRRAPLQDGGRPRSPSAVSFQRQIPFIYIFMHW